MINIYDICYIWKMFGFGLVKNIDLYGWVMKLVVWFLILFLYFKLYF